MAMTLEARYRRDAHLRRMNMSKARRLPWNERLIWARLRKGYSQQTLAERAGLQRTHLMKLERGEHKPHPATREKLGAALGQPADFFKDDDDEEGD